MCAVYINSRYIPIEVILKQGVVIVCHFHLFRVISKQAAIIVSHFHLLQWI